MLPRVQSPAPATESVHRTSNKLLRLLRMRFRQLIWGALVLAVCLALAAGALEIEVRNSLNGLPNIGDPFDVAAFRAFKVPDDQNAFTFLRRAHEKLTRQPEADWAQLVYRSRASWSELDPEVRAWVEANRPAVELFLQGAEQADGISRPAGEDYSRRYQSLNSGWLLMWLTLVEGGRRQESGDMAGAWDCYRAVLRMTAHVRRRESLIDRRIVNVHNAALRKRLATWAVDPRTTIPQLRRALDTVVACQPRREWDAFTLKSQYLDLMRFLEQPDNRPREPLEDDLTYRLGELQLPPDRAMQLYGVRRHLAREPERSRRVIRLLFANWLVQVENPDPRQRKPAVRARFHVAKKTTSVLLYPVSPEAPAGARALSPQELANWLVTTIDAKLALWEGRWPSHRLTDELLASVRRTEASGHRQLLVLLAGELYHRERGGLPPSEAALVGTYLKVLPDDDSSELDDGQTPTVSDSASSAGAENR
jgi:hypothetical protein